MSYKAVMKELESLGTEQTRKIYTNHGADIPQFGVSIANLKKIAKKYKKDKELGYQLYHSNNVDAIYLSQFIMDSNRLTKEDFDTVIESTDYYMILDNVVALLIAKNKDVAFELLDDYIESDNPRKRQVAYSLYSYILTTYKNEEIDFNHVKKYIFKVNQDISNEANRVKYSMNNFLISAGAATLQMSDLAKEIAKHIGKVEVYMGKTSCKVPDALSYIEKIERMNNIGKKRKL